MTDNREATVLQFAMFMQARDARYNGEFNGVTWEMLADLGGQEAYLKDAEIYLSAIEMLGYSQITPGLISDENMPVADVGRLDLSRIEELAEKATPGPWEVDDNRPFSRDLQGIFATTVKRYALKIDYDEQPETRHDAEFIAESRTAVPALVAEVRTYAERISAAERILLGGIGQSWSRVVDRALLALRGADE